MHLHTFPEIALISLGGASAVMYLIANDVNVEQEEKFLQKQIAGNKAVQQKEQEKLKIQEQAAAEAKARNLLQTRATKSLRTAEKFRKQATYARDKANQLQTQATESQETAKISKVRTDLFLVTARLDNDRALRAAKTMQETVTPEGEPEALNLESFRLLIRIKSEQADKSQAALDKQTAQAKLDKSKADIDTAKAEVAEAYACGVEARALEEDLKAQIAQASVDEKDVTALRAQLSALSRENVAVHKTCEDIREKHREILGDDFGFLTR